MALPAPPTKEEWDKLDLLAIRDRAEKLKETLGSLGDAVGLEDFTVVRLLGTGANAHAYLASCKPDGRLASHTDTLVVLKALIKLRQPGASAAERADQERAFQQMLDKETKGPGFPE